MILKVGSNSPTPNETEDRKVLTAPLKLGWESGQRKLPSGNPKAMCTFTSTTAFTSRSGLLPVSAGHEGTKSVEVLTSGVSFHLCSRISRPPGQGCLRTVLQVEASFLPSSFHPSYMCQICATISPYSLLSVSFIVHKCLLYD